METGEPMANKFIGLVPAGLGIVSVIVIIKLRGGRWSSVCKCVT